MRRIPQQGHATIRNLLRFALPFDLSEMFIQSVDIDQALFVESQPCLRLQDAPHGSVQPLARDASGTGGISSASAPATNARTAASPGAYRTVIPPMSIASVTTSPW